MNTNFVAPKCGFWRGHNWSKWQTKQESTLSKEGKIKGFMILQERICLDCGFKQLDSQKRTVYD